MCQCAEAVDFKEKANSNFSITLFDKVETA